MAMEDWLEISADDCKCRDCAPDVTITVPKNVITLVNMLDNEVGFYGNNPEKMEKSDWNFIRETARTIRDAINEKIS